MSSLTFGLTKEPRQGLSRYAEILGSFALDYVIGEDLKAGDLVRLGPDGKLYRINSNKLKRIAEGDFIQSLKSNPAYTHINLDHEFKRIDDWLKRHPDRMKTRAFVLRWLQKIEVPLNFQTNNKIRKLME